MISPPHRRTNCCTNRPVKGPAWIWIPCPAAAKMPVTSRPAGELPFSSAVRRRCCQVTPSSSDQLRSVCWMVGSSGAIPVADSKKPARVPAAWKRKMRPVSASTSRLGITEALQASAAPHHFLAAPGLPVVRAAPDQEIDGAGQVIEVRPAVVGGEDGAPCGDGERRDPVLAVAPAAPDGEDVLG